MLLHRSFPLFCAGLFLLHSLSGVLLGQDSQEAQDTAVSKPTSDPKPDQKPAAKKLVDFQRDIVPLLSEHCLSCHAGENAKEGFQVNDREALLGIVTPGSIENSSLWTDYLMADPKTLDKKSLVMPPDGPLPKAELALVKLWIEEGADWPEGVEFGDHNDKLPELPPGAIPSRVFRAIGYFHPAVIHFPIALLSLAGLSLIASLVFGQGAVRFAYACLWLGALGAVVSAVMGWSFADIRGFSPWTTMIGREATEEQTNEFFHRWLGTFTAIASIIVAIMAFRDRKPDGTRPGKAWRIGTLILAVLVGIVGHQGGELVYGDIFAKAIEQFTK